MYFHWQNLNEKPGDNYEASGHPFRHGRAWFNWEEQRRALEVEWTHGGLHLALGIRFEGDGGKVQLQAALPLLFQYFVGFSSPGIRKLMDRLKVGWDTRVISAVVHHGSFWWSIWAKEGEWNSTDPWWMSGSFDPLDFLFGMPHFESEVISTQDVLIPTPERVYEATFTLERRFGGRPRWPFKKEFRGSTVEVKDRAGVPVPGKGENSWDCGPNSIHSQSSPETNPHDAVMSFLRSVFRDRLRYGGRYTYSPSRVQ